MTDLTIIRGATFSRVLRWESLPFIYTPITAISQAAPVVITAAGHGLVSGWRAAVLSASGMRQINSKNAPPRASDLHKVTVTSSSQLNFNRIDSTFFTAYTSGGFLCSYTPVSLSGFTATLKIFSTLADTVLLLALAVGSGITLDDVNHTITLTIDAAVTEALTWDSGHYELELASEDLTPVVTRLMHGSITVEES